MGKIMNVITSVATIGCLAATGYLVLKNQNKSMLDVIIEEIETIK